MHAIVLSKCTYDTIPQAVCFSRDPPYIRDATSKNREPTRSTKEPVALRHALL